MNAALLVLALGAGTLAVAAASSGKRRGPTLSNMRGKLALGHRGVHGLPNAGGVTWKIRENTHALQAYMKGRAVPPWTTLAGMTANKSAPPYNAAEREAIALARQFSEAMSAAFVERRNLLPADADKTFTDQYSKELYPLPAWLGKSSLTPYDLSAVIWTPRDEFGRLLPGKYGQAGGLWEATFGGLLQNPLGAAIFKAAVIYFTGPAGVAALGAYSMWEQRGADLSLKDFALKAAREYAVSQCGVACGVAFDIGVGVASGQSVEEAAESALVKELAPEERAAYEAGKAEYQKKKQA